MKEFVTDAIVMRVDSARNADTSALLFTKDLGKVRVRVAGGAKPLSKFAPHLDPMNFVVVRLAYKNGFTLTDALTCDRFACVRAHVALFGGALRALALIATLAAEGERDEWLWHELLRILAGDARGVANLLAHLGYDLSRASCEHCGASHVVFFASSTHAFLCAACSTRVPERTLVSLEA